MSNPTGEQRSEHILVVDDDVHIASFVRFELESKGFTVDVAHDGATAYRMILANQPDLLIVDLMMPIMGGMELTRKLRADSLTSVLPIIMLTAKGMAYDKVMGLNEGADDYLVKPFETMELVARIETILRRSQEFRDISPLTGLPGNSRILREVDTRIRIGDPFAVCYCDIDGFKAVNDAYGFARGDEFINTLARELARAVRETSGPPSFLGHIGGDDFVVVCHPDLILPLIEVAVARFEKAADGLYDEHDRARGYVTVRDRTRGNHDVGLVMVSTGVALSTRRAYTDARELIADAGEMKKVAKSQPGSYIAVDRRGA